MKEIITSPQNAKIKNIVQLIDKSSERRKQNLLVVEGAREIHLAIASGFTISNLFVCPELKNTNELVVTFNFPTHKIIEVSKPVFNKIAFRENSDGLVALLTPVYYKLEELKLSATPLIIVVESVEKPGNLGAILRTADAAKVDAVIVCDPRTDIYNPNCIRSSVGCVFTNQVVASTSSEVITWLKHNKIKVYSAALTAEKLYHQTDLSGAVALVMGTEADGLTDFWLTNCDAQIKIPMLGKIDSLNVSASTGILVFEAMRQRNFKK